MSPVLTDHSGEWKSHQSGSLEGLQMKELLSLWIYFVVTSTVTQLAQQPRMGTCILRHCPDPQLTDSDEVLLKPAELVQFIRTLLGVR